jgi:uncharacterized protein DUF87
MDINKVNQRTDLNTFTSNLVTKNNQEVKEEELEEEVKQGPQNFEAGVELLIKNQRIPLGRFLKSGQVSYFKINPTSDKTFNIFTFLASMGSGKSTLVRNMIYYLSKIDQKCINIIFDPMYLEYSLLSFAVDKETNPDEYEKKLKYLPEDILTDPDTGDQYHYKVLPDKLEVFHIIPRFALIKDVWNRETQTYTRQYDEDVLKLLKKEGGIIIAEDISKLTEEQIFTTLNYSELKQNAAIHFYLRSAIKICNREYGTNSWFVQHMIKVLKDGVKNNLIKKEIKEDEIPKKQEKKQLSSNELELIEQLEKYRQMGYFVQNYDERSKYCMDWRDIIQQSKILNISFLAVKRGDKIGTDLVRGQVDLILQRLQEISQEYFNVVDKKRRNSSMSEWENWLIENWNVNMYTEESEIFLPRDIQEQNISKTPCCKRFVELNKTGRKYGFHNFFYITQRCAMLNKIVLDGTSHMFISSLNGKDRDQIIKDFAIGDGDIQSKDGQKTILRGLITTLNKEKHEWLFINKSEQEINAIRTYDSPCG